MKWVAEIDNGDVINIEAPSAALAAEYATQRYIENHGSTAWDEDEHEVAVWLAAASPTPILHFVVVINVTWSFSAHECERAEDDD